MCLVKFAYWQLGEFLAGLPPASSLAAYPPPASSLPSAGAASLSL